MKRPLWKHLIIGGLLAAATLLSGCGATRFAYGQGPELAYWWLDGYADFNSQQTTRLREALEAWFRWHRGTQLADYEQLLTRMQAMAAGPVTPEQVCRLNDDLQSRIDPMLERAMPAAVEIVQSLTPQQIAHIERKYTKVNAEFRSDYLQPDLNERAAKSLERAVERAEGFYGDLSEAQVDLLKRAIAASPFDPQLWLDERIARQQDALRTLRRLVSEKASAEQTQAALRQLVRNVQRSPREAYVSYQAKLTQYNCQVTAQLHNSTTREQRTAVVKKLKSWEEDARALAAESMR